MTASKYTRFFEGVAYHECEPMRHSIKSSLRGRYLVLMHGPRGPEIRIGNKAEPLGAFRDAWIIGWVDEQIGDLRYYAEASNPDSPDSEWCVYDSKEGHLTNRNGKACIESALTETEARAIAKFMNERHAND